eukprot:367816-Pyramimonas_sp.AAC.1
MTWRRFGNGARAEWGSISPRCLLDALFLRLLVLHGQRGPLLVLDPAAREDVHEALHHVEATERLLCGSQAGRWCEGPPIPLRGAQLKAEETHGVDQGGE